MFASFASYFSAGLGISFFPEIEPEQAVVQVKSRGDLSATEKDKLLQRAELQINGLEEYQRHTQNQVQEMGKKRKML